MVSSFSVNLSFSGISYQIHSKYNSKKVHLKNIFRDIIHFCHVGLSNFLIKVLLITFVTILYTMPWLITHIAFSFELLRETTFGTLERSLVETLLLLVFIFCTYSITLVLNSLDWFYTFLSETWMSLLILNLTIKSSVTSPYTYALSNFWILFMMVVIL